MRVMPLQIFLWCCVLLKVALALTGDNVCRRVETDSETVQYVVQEPVTYRIYTWCLKVPPRCSKYSTVMKERIKTKLEINNHTIEECCEGYIELAGICVSECNSTECPNMICETKEDLLKCKCKSGFMGYKCNRPCLYGFWGEGCFDKCECNGESCNAATGDCIISSTTATSPLTTISSTSETRPTTNTIQSTKSRITSKPTQRSKSTSQQISSSVTPPYSTSTKLDKNELSQEMSPDLSLDPTGMPPVLPGEDFPTTLIPLPEDEVIVLYPTLRTQTTSEVLKPARKINLPASTTEKYITSSSIARPPNLKDTAEKSNNDLSNYNHFTQASEMNSKSAKEILDSLLPPPSSKGDSTDSTKSLDYYQKNPNRDTASTISPASTKFKYNSDTWRKLENNNDFENQNNNDFDNNLGMQITSGVKNYTDYNKNGLNTNEIQKDMQANSNYDNLSSADVTINSSLVKAKWHGALDVIDFNSLSVLISLTATIILSMILITISVVRCNRLKIEETAYASTMTCESPTRTGHYSTPGQPIFFCPTFTNSYAFELAQELREAHYDHPRSARCLNEPVYAELRY